MNLLGKLGIDSQWVSGVRPASARSHIAWGHMTPQTVGPHVGDTPLVTPYWKELTAKTEAMPQGR